MTFLEGTQTAKGSFLFTGHTDVVPSYGLKLFTGVAGPNKYTMPFMTGKGYGCDM